MSRNVPAPLTAGLAAVSMVLITGLGISGCGTEGGAVDDPVTGTPYESLPPKAGLDGPPVPVGPFLDGAFPPNAPNDLSSSTWNVVEAFPNVIFNQTLVIETNPEPGNDRLYVGSRDGNIFSFENDPATAVADPFMDIRDRVAVVWDGGFLGLAFHPEFGQAGSPYETTFYVYYSSFCPTVFDGQQYVNDWPNCNPGYPQSSTGGYFNTWLRLSRFEAFWDAGSGTWRGDPTSEVPMFNIRLYNGSHRGSGPVFGRDPGGSWDGTMYVAIGDQFRYETAQTISNNFEGGTVRLEVDITDNGDGTWTCPAGSHLPVRRFQDVTGNPDEMTGQQYCIPDDNPWVDPTGADFGEFFTIGHRNPHRIAIDPVTGRMWSGEVGQSTREEINILFKGHNYQWPYREGLTTGVRSRPATVIGIEQPPVIDFDRTEARAIIGGYVYRGTRYPELFGKYLAGDYVTNNVWAITLDENTLTATKEFLTSFGPGGLATWGQDKAGEVYLGDVFGNDALYTLERVGEPNPEPPALLSELGAFSDVPNFVPSPYWVPYGLNQPFWSDGAEKFRWIALPNDGSRDTAGEQVAYSENGTWGYPTGTVLMKHFELVLDENDPTDRTRLETRYMIKGESGDWYGVTYRWNTAQTDADLLSTFEVQNYDIALADGSTRTQTWYFPSRLDCLSCHSQAAGGALGLNTRQQNGDFFYEATGRTENQLVTWNGLDMFAPPVDELTLPNVLTSPEFTDVTAPLGLRARSWLDSNCGYCHRPGAVNAGFDMRLTTPFENQGMVFAGVRDDLGVPGLTVLTPGEPGLSAIYLRSLAVGPNGMPPLAKELPQTPAVDILGEWITRVDADFGQNGINYEYYEPGALSVLPDFSVLTPVATGVVNSFDIGVRQQDDQFAFRFTSTLFIGQAGDYTFFTSSDDGSQLFIDGALVVDNDGLHGVREEQGTVSLTVGYHAIEVTMFENGGGQALTVNYQGPDTSGIKGAIGIDKLFLQTPDIQNDPPTLSDPGPQSDSAGAPLALALSGNDPNGDFLYYDAAGLPSGTDIDHATGIITGTATAGTYEVTASASDASEVSVVSFTWTITGGGGGPICGDGNLDAGEECDDGNNTNGDGCSSVCTIEVAPACGDGNLDAGEECDDGNLIDGDGCSSVCTIEVAPACGDGNLDAGEQCDDGNLVDGDGCSSVCTLESGGDLTQLGTIIARITEPRGSGSKDIEIIRDGIMPMPGDTSRSLQYDTYSGGDPATEDWFGYTYSTDQLFGQVVFQEGREFSDGGFFVDIRVEVLQDGAWVVPPNLTVTPAYAGADGVSYNTYVFDFDATLGQGIRVNGTPGGTKYFTSVAELTVFGPSIPPLCGNGAPDGGEECDDGNLVNGDGCSAACLLEVCGDGAVNNNGLEECDDGNLVDGDGCSSTCTTEILPVCGDGNVDPGEACDDGNSVDGDGCSSVCQVEICGDGAVNNNGLEECDDGNTVSGDGCASDCTFETGADLTQIGTIVARITAPQGSGNPDIEIIRDGIMPLPGDRSRSNQYDTFSGGDPATEDWYGYTYTTDQLFGQVVFQEGREFSDGGFFIDIRVEILQGGTWVVPANLVVTPTYAGADGISYNTYVFDFAPTVGQGIRVNGTPGGTKYFTSVAELLVYGPTTPPLCGNGVTDDGEECDDGNLANGDGCSAACETEECGDGTVNNGGTEACDDGNLVDGDGCTAACELEVCGDGLVNNAGAEACDDGNTIDGDGCTAACQLEVCGDGVVNNAGAEACDDGNTIDGDGCTAACQLEVCGDGVVNNAGAETCDDGNTIDGDGCSAACQIEVSAFCGDGSLDAGEECDDGNTVDGDGCNFACVLEVCGDGIVNNVTEECEPPNTATCTATCGERVPLCGDGFVTLPEECDDSNTVDGDGCSSTCTIEVVVTCGDGVVGGTEQCDDGNTVSGDGCASDCTFETGADLTQLGTPIARITAPRGSGNKNIEVIRDGDKPMVGDTSRDRQYDTYSGGDFAAEDWFGYQYDSDQLFGQVVFQEGREFSDGGFFIDVTIQVLQDGAWVEAPNVIVTPAYAGADGISYNTYVFDFDPVIGRGIRVHGAPGGTKYFTSVAELEVFGPTTPPLCGNGALDAGEECDDGNLAGGDGCTGFCEVEVCGDGVINNNGLEACDDGNLVDGDGCSSVCTIEILPFCGDSALDAGEECDDGNMVDGDGCSSACLVEFCGDGTVNNNGLEECDDGNLLSGDGCAADCTVEGGADLTQLGTPIARITEPRGSGNKDIEVIRDGDKPMPGDRSRTRQYDTYSGGSVATEDWFGYQYTSDQTFGQVVFLEGREFSDGGFFVDITIQVLQSGVWVEAPNVIVTPTYAGADGVSYNTYVFDFDPVVGQGIRVYGTPGGTKYFTSVAELEVFAAE